MASFPFSLSRIYFIARYRLAPRCSSLIRALISANDRPAKRKIVRIIIGDGRLKASSIDSRAPCPQQNASISYVICTEYRKAVAIRFNWCFSIVSPASVAPKTWHSNVARVLQRARTLANDAIGPSDTSTGCLPPPAPYFLAACSLTPYIPT